MYYIFNPDNDLALANFSPSYTPPASAVKLGIDLSLLPLWYADNEAVVAQSNIDDSFIANVNKLFGISSKVIQLSEMSLIEKSELNITPWGWSPMIKNKLLNAGIEADVLPTNAYIGTIREYSNRKNAVAVLRELKTYDNKYLGDSYFFTDIEDLLVYLSSTEGDKALKMPLSGSGRGLIWVLGSITDKQTDWARRVIRNQGGVVAEPKLDRVQDFAMEFSMSNGVATFEGYSLFETAASGAYMGNVLMRDNEIENYLSKYISIEQLYYLQNQLLNKLESYFPLYEGILGVDMMICNTNDGYGLYPCVEINIRMNMGMVSHIFYERFVDNQSKGHYRVDYFKKPGEALTHHQKMTMDFPLILENARIILGYMALTPVDVDTNYVAWVDIKRPTDSR